MIEQPGVVIRDQAGIGHNGGPRMSTRVEQSRKAFGAGKWAVIAGALWSAVVASGYLPPAFATAEFASAVGGLISTIAAAIGAYRACECACARFERITI